ncbi:hypothetical protein HUU40_30135, partial [candidate division KSB1 bacterium]|nr:hypothetical protein [candidate division KSB1 bacterium]
MSKHHLNPFDFVPFANEAPDLKTVEQWRSIDPQGVVTGYLELQIEALTPVHVVGRQDNATPDGQKLSQSHFCRRGGQALIPGSSIRGLLRAFIEAACNCWASQMTPYYMVDKNRRNLAFLVVDAAEEFKNKGGEIDKALRLSLPKQFVPQPGISGPVDLASYLFGYVSPEKKGQARLGVVKINDAVAIEPFADYEMPDVAGKAFMGSPNPSAKTWWYHLPYAIRKRRTQIKGRAITVVDFLGEHFRGRKFYYHQDPV